MTSEVVLLSIRGQLAVAALVLPYILQTVTLAKGIHQTLARLGGLELSLQGRDGVWSGCLQRSNNF